MSWHYSRALVAEFSGVCSSVGEQSAPLNSTNTPDLYCWPGKTIEPSSRSRSGMTCELLTGARGEAVLTSFQAAFPVRTFQPPVRAKGSPENDPASGGKWRELSVRFDRDSCSWKTHLCLWVEGLLWSSVILPQWGSMLAGVCWELMTSALPTAEKGSGLWPTPQAYSKGKPSNSPPGITKLDTAVRWPTPTAGDSRSSGSRNLPGSKAHAGMSLTDAVKFGNSTTPRKFPTPRASDADRGGRGDLIQAVRGNPNSHYKMWPTPRNNTGPDVSKRHLSLDGAVRLYPTPCSTDWKGSSKPGQRRGQLSETVAGGQLNPTWVEWLMGWPIGWTDLKPLATARFRLWLEQHGRS